MAKGGRLVFSEWGEVDVGQTVSSMGCVRKTVSFCRTDYSKLSENSAWNTQKET
jgi:hypothetical protein